MNGLTKLVIVLAAVFLVTLLALVANVLYVLWRRRNFSRRSGTEFPGGDPFYNMTPSKEQLLYFFCWKNQSRIEPAGNTAAPHPAPEGPEMVVILDDDDAAKWPQGMYGPSRVLFTIKEEDREGAETTSETENDHHQFNIKPLRSEVESQSQIQRLTEVDVAVDFEETPFSTPCASPPYYTPSPSPTHDKYLPGNDEKVSVTLKVENDMSSLGLEV